MSLRIRLSLADMCGESTSGSIFQLTSDRYSVISFSDLISITVVIAELFPDVRDGTRLDSKALRDGSVCLIGRIVKTGKRLFFFKGEDFVAEVSLWVLVVCHQIPPTLMNLTRSEIERHESIVPTMSKSLSM